VTSVIPFSSARRGSPPNGRHAALCRLLILFWSLLIRSRPCSARRCWRLPRAVHDDAGFAGRSAHADSDGRLWAVMLAMTVRQGESGLRLEAQRATVEAFMPPWRGHCRVVCRGRDGKAVGPAGTGEGVAACKGRATLLIAKLDRLARNGEQDRRVLAVRGWTRENCPATFSTPLCVGGACVGAERLFADAPR
jgi:hypothetical protein